MEKAKIRPLATPKPLNRSSQKLAGVITSWMAPGRAPGMQNFVGIDFGVSAPQIRDFAVPFDVTSFFYLFGVLQPTPVNGFLRKIGRRKTRRLDFG